MIRFFYSINFLWQRQDKDHFVQIFCITRDIACGNACKSNPSYKWIHFLFAIRRSDKAIFFVVIRNLLAVRKLYCKKWASLLSTSCDKKIFTRRIQFFPCENFTVCCQNSDWTSIWQISLRFMVTWFMYVYFSMLGTCKIRISIYVSLYFANFWPH